LLIGDLQISQLADALFKAYESENTRFVKSSYLTALLQLDIPQLVPELTEHKKLLEQTEITEENRKHVDEELREINKILIKYNGIKQHTPILEGVRAELLLTTNKLHREIVRRQLPVKETKLHPLGVIVKTDNIRLIMKVRTYRQMYFMINTEGLLSGNEREMASQLWKSDMYDILRRMHREPGPFYYRIESSADGEFQSRLSAALDRLSGGKLINSANNYEVVIKLIQ
ncbi:methylase, partial [[Eubacterium] rectale]|nr:methylase [Agathobacter rectalis]